MGSFFTRIQSALGLLSSSPGAAGKEYRVLVLGLDNAGKTSVLYRLQLGTVVSTVPTVGFNLETLVYKNLTFQVWDLGGQTGIRPFWRCYFSGTDAIIYVVDSTDKERLGVAKHELFALLDEDELKSAVVLILANKQDLPGAASVTDVAHALGVTMIQNRAWTIVKTSAHTGEGLVEGMDWLCDRLRVK